MTRLVFVLVVLVGFIGCAPLPPIPVKYVFREIARFQSCTRIGDAYGMVEDFLAPTISRSRAVALYELRKNALAMGATHVNVDGIACGTFGKCVAKGDVFKCVTDVGGMED